MPTDRHSAKLKIGKRTFTIPSSVYGGTPRVVLRVLKVAKSLPDGQLFTTREFLIRAGYRPPIVGLVNHPLLIPYRYQYSYHTTLWGNEKEIAYVKKASESKNHI